MGGARAANGTAILDVMTPWSVQILTIPARGKDQPAEVNLTAGAWTKVEVPLSSDGRALITATTVLAPRLHDMNEDDRRLGVAVRSIEIKSGQR
jgi:hypothetical protein